MSVKPSSSQRTRWCMGAALPKDRVGNVLVQSAAGRPTLSAARQAGRIRPRAALEQRRGGPGGPPRLQRWWLLSGGSWDYQKLPWASAALLQPPCPCVVQSRVYPPPALRVIENVLPLFDVAVTVNVVVDDAVTDTRPWPAPYARPVEPSADEVLHSV